MAIEALISPEVTGGRERHSWLHTALAAYLFNRRRPWHIRVYSSPSIWIAPNKCPVPDLAVVSGEEPAEQALQMPPQLVIELVLPEDGTIRVNNKIQQWRDFGVPYVWVVDPETLESELHDGRGRTSLDDGVLRIPGTAIEVPLHLLDEE
jgi:Uma2 family endonuclease